MPLRTVFMGSDSFSLPVLDALLETPATNSITVELVAVVTQPDRQAGRGRRISVNPVKARALDRGLLCLQPDRLRDADVLDRLSTLEPHLGVVASFGQILPRRVLDLPRHGCLNLHPSLLPLYRGPSPVVSTILNGDAVTGTSLMLMEVQMDAGPLIGQVEIDVLPNETAGDLEHRLSILSAKLLIDRLPGWISGAIVPERQLEEAATYTSKVTKSDGLIDWHETARVIARKARAYSPWPSAFTFWRGDQVSILQAEVMDDPGEPGLVYEAPGGGIAIGAAEGSLRIHRLQLSGRRPVTARDFLQGHRDFIGALLTGDAA